MKHEKSALAVFLLIGLPQLLWAQSPSQLQVTEFESTVFGNTRQLRILLPEGYADPDNVSRHYPVLYLNDGQNLFDAATAVLGNGEWQADETVRRLIADGVIPPVIVVGIDNAGRSGRANEYLPYPDIYLEPPLPDPKGQLYPAFIAEEVVPFIESRFRVQADEASRTLGGSSYGALIALHTVIVRPGFFAGVLLESPSFYVDNDHVLRDAKASPPGVQRVYLGIGTNELDQDDCPADHPGNVAAVTSVQTLAGILRAAGMAAELVKVEIEDCAVHAESAWARRLPAALKFLYAD
jgi:predicted alpha/beta superfamily hydrolase